MTWPLRFGRKFAAGIDFLNQGFWGQKDSFQDNSWRLHNIDLAFKLQGGRDEHRNLDRSRAADCL